LTVSSNSYSLHTQLVGLIDNSKRSFVAKGKLLHGLKTSGNFRDAVGDGIDTWDDYISQPEINLSRGEADRLIQIYETFVLRFEISEEELSEVPIKNLHYLLPLAKKSYDMDAMQEMVESAKTLSQKDFKLRVGEIKYDGKVTYEYLVMRRCIETGSLTKVWGISSDEIKANHEVPD